MGEEGGSTFSCSIKVTQGVAMLSHQKTEAFLDAGFVVLHEMGLVLCLELHSAVTMLLLLVLLYVAKIFPKLCYYYGALLCCQCSLVVCEVWCTVKHNLVKIYSFSLR